MTDLLGRLKLNFGNPRSAIKPVDLPRRNTFRQIGVCTEPYRENRLWAFPERPIECCSPIRPNTSHAAPKSETLTTDKEVRLQRSEIAFLGRRGQEAIVTTAVVQHHYGPDCNRSERTRIGSTPANNKYPSLSLANVLIAVWAKEQCGFSLRSVANFPA